MSENRVRKSVVRHTLFNYYPDMLIGYARVSTDDQNRDLQRDALQRAGCERIFEEKESGRAGTKRPALEAALAFLRPEDQLVVWKVDRLGRSLREMLDTAHKLQGQGVRLRSLTEAIDTETSTGRLMFNFLGTIAEYFLDLNRERTIEGLKAAARPRPQGRTTAQALRGRSDNGSCAAEGHPDPRGADCQAAEREQGHVLRLLSTGKDKEPAIRQVRLDCISIEIHIAS